MCGAWHAPALQAGEHGAKSDAALLKGIKRRKISATWIPWTARRLSYRSGYGAGVASPGWYEHLWTRPGATRQPLAHPPARLLRSEDLDASPASVVEAVRLAETLAALRDLPAPGLEELHEAALATLCEGETEQLALIRDRLEIGDRLGEVPAEAPAVPLQRDLEGAAAPAPVPSAEERSLDLDLRERERPRAQPPAAPPAPVAVAWGEPRTVGGKSGTFHELWHLPGVPSSRWP